MGNQQYKHINTQSLPGIISDVISIIHDEYHSYNIQGMPPGKLDKRIKRLEFLQDIYSHVAQTPGEIPLVEKFMKPLLWSDAELTLYNQLKQTYNHCQDVVTKMSIPIIQDGQTRNVVWQQHSSQINLQINNQIQNPTPSQQHSAILQDIDQSIIGIQFKAQDVENIVNIIKNSDNVDGDILRKFIMLRKMTITQDFTNYKPYGAELTSRRGKKYQIVINANTQICCIFSQHSGSAYVRRRGFNSGIIPLLTRESYEKYYRMFFNIFDSFEDFCQDFEETLAAKYYQPNKKHISATLSGGTGFNIYLTNKIIDKYNQLANIKHRTKEQNQQLTWLDKYRAQVNDLFKWGDIDFKLKIETDQKYFNSLITKFDNFLINISNSSLFNLDCIEFRQLDDMVIEYDDQGAKSRIINMYVDNKETEIEYRSEQNKLKYDTINIYKNMDIGDGNVINAHIARIYRIFVPIKGYFNAGDTSVVNYKMEVFDFSLSYTQLMQQSAYNKYGEECFNKLMSSRKDIVPLRKNMTQLIDFYFQK